ncbi:MAG TPA: ATP-dependent DNA helicase [Burkholderiaceae bacterium]|nr:ATP-dependent DNA helicase [Burkholderiaceae bacterium]
MSVLDDLFRPGGALARAFEGFVSRPSQRRMAARIAEALERREHLLIEAGTGTGKTFAYLVPALVSGLRVLISTGTRTLQDQLYTRDIPLLAGALGRPLTTALLKGRANYLCLARLGGGGQQALLADEEPTLLAQVREWAATTRSGDLSEVAALGESHPLRAQLTSTREACTGARCPEFARCHVFAARRAALEADLVVVNHHLLLADLALKEEGFGELLPGVDALILDEAHQLPDLAAEFFGVSCSSRQFETLLHDARAELAALSVPAGAIARLQALVETPLQALGARLGRHERRLSWEELGAEARADCASLHAALGDYASALESQGDAAGIAQCAARARSLAADLAQVMSEPDEAQSGGARGVAVNPRGFALSLLPYDISARFRGLVDQHPSAWIFTSATLALGGNFQHFATRLGLGDAATLCLESPFDYERQALLYLPERLPDPAASGYTEAVLAAARPLLEASEGGAFLLFTSHRALRIAAQALRAADWIGDWPLLVQNDAPRELLLRRFRESGRAVLLGTASFWEGVDVQGVALRLVVIDKLPFASPEDPQVRARAQYLQSQGVNAFRDYQLPEAALALKQGVGRLIRSEEDRGVVMICDPRLLTRGYGRSLLAALPPLRPTRELGEAVALLERSARELEPA